MEVRGWLGLVARVSLGGRLSRSWRGPSADTLHSVYTGQRGFCIPIPHPPAQRQSPHLVHLSFTPVPIPGNANESIFSPVSRYGLWPQAGLGSAYTPSRLKTESGPLLSAHYSGKGDVFGYGFVPYNNAFIL